MTNLSSDIAFQARFTSLLLSPTVTVKVGHVDNPRTLEVHREIFSSNSSPILRALVEGDWKESAAGIIDWTEKNLNVDTTEDFLRFFDFLYTGDYVVPFPISPPIAAAVPGTSNKQLYQASNPVHRGFSAPIVASSTKTSTLVSVPPRSFTPFNVYPDVTGKADQARLTAFGRFEALSPPPHPFPDVTKHLLAHAKLYTLANRYLVESLEVLCVQRMRQVLCYISKPSLSTHVTGFGIRDLRKYSGSGLDAEDRNEVKRRNLGRMIVPLIQYLYDNTPSREDKVDPMRELVSSFCVHHGNDLECEQFKDLLCAGGDFVIEYTTALQKQLEYYSQQYPNCGNSNREGVQITR